MKTFLLLLLVGLNVSAQIKPYSFSIKKESAIVVPSLVMLGASYYIGKNKTVISDAYIQTLNISSIPKFDRLATRQFNQDFNTVSNIAAYGSILLPTLHLIHKDSRSDFKNIAVLYTETFMLNTAVTMLTKEWVSRDRPYLYNNDVPLSYKKNRDAQRSFFSGHTSLTASNCFFFATTFSHYHPNSKLKPWVWTGCAILPAITAFSRVKAGKHFPSDVVVGYLLGAAVGAAVPLIHHQRHKN